MTQDGFLGVPVATWLRQASHGGQVYRAETTHHQNGVSRPVATHRGESSFGAKSLSE